MTARAVGKVPQLRILLRLVRRFLITARSLSFQHLYRIYHRFMLVILRQELFVKGGCAADCWYVVL